MDKKIFLIIFAYMILLVLIIEGAIAASFYSGNTGASFINFQSRASYQTYYTQQDLGRFWPILTDDPESCKGREDIILQIAPAGCQPAVARSDLLAEQNYPVFCQIDAIQLNPLLSIEEIDRIDFSGNYSKGKEIIDVGFHPARAFLRTGDVLSGKPAVNNVGYA